MSVATENLQIGQLAVLQPVPHRDDAFDAPVTIDDRLIHATLLRLVHIWAYQRKGLPKSFIEEVQISRVRRQPVAFVGIAVQRVGRRLIDVVESYSGGPVNANEWSTEDLFALCPVRATMFPPEKTNLNEAVPGREAVRTCEECAGAGSNVCQDCEGAGQVICTVCAGMGTVICSQCNGAGVVVRGGQDLVNCPHCRQGSVQCPHCASGLVDCISCLGEGHLVCVKCQGTGNLLRRWELMTQTATIQTCEAHCSEPWPVIDHDLFHESERVTTAEWAWPTQGEHPVPLRDLFPTPLVPSAERLLERTLATHLACDTATERVSGVRVGLSATYAYEVILNVNGREGLIFVAGSSSLAFPVSIPGGDIGDRVFAALNRAFSKIGLGDHQGVVPAYVNAVRSRSAHLMDASCKVPALMRFGAQVRVTPQGYVVTIVHPRDNNNSVTFEVYFDVSRSRELVLVTRCSVGQAHRDRWPVALAHNHRFLVGHIGLVRNSNTGEEQFVLVDRRPYELVDSHEYYLLLVELAGNVWELRERQVLM